MSSRNYYLVNYQAVVSRGIIMIAWVIVNFDLHV